jgi:hypothetical protein
MSLQTAFHIAGILLALGGAVVFFHALLWDRARERRRCPACWYDMSAGSALQCPECGATPANEAALRRTRRHWRRAAVALVLVLAAYPLFHFQRVRTGGWRGAIPTTALIWWVTANEPAETFRNGAMNTPTGEAKELARRVSSEGLAGWRAGSGDGHCGASGRSGCGSDGRRASPCWSLRVCRAGWAWPVSPCARRSHTPIPRWTIT